RARAAAEAALEHTVRRAARVRGPRRARQPASVLRYSDAERVRHHRARRADERRRDRPPARRAPGRGRIRRADGSRAPVPRGPLTAGALPKESWARGAATGKSDDSASDRPAPCTGRHFEVTDLELAHLHRRVSQLKEEAR